MVVALKKFITKADEKRDAIKALIASYSFVDGDWISKTAVLRTQISESSAQKSAKCSWSTATTICHLDIFHLLGTLICVLSTP